ncbi:MAG: hypothetical protein AAF125_15990 [Chloroflexota bacterium]
MKTLPLNNNWSVEYFDPDVDGFEMAPAPEPIPRIEEWGCSGRFSTAGFYAYLRRSFEIDMTPNQCVRYVVQIEGAPSTTRFYVNDTYMGDVTGRAERFDITDYISLGTNKLNLRLSCSEESKGFEAVVLLQIPCEDA